MRPAGMRLEEIVEGGEWNGHINVYEKVFRQPFYMSGEKAVIWTAQLCDLWHEGVSDEVRIRILSVIAKLPNYLFVVTTKRPQAMKDWLSAPGRLEQVRAAAEKWDRERGASKSPIEWPLPSLCIGVSIEDQASADAMVPLLMATPAARRVVWVAPMLGPVDLSQWPEVDWIICRGEEGADRRAPGDEWIRSLKNFAVANEIPFHFRGSGDGSMEVDGDRWEQVPARNFAL